MAKCSFRNGRGQSIVELTLVLPLLLALVGGVTDLSMAFLVSNVVQNASREGAQLAATLPALQANDSRIATAVDAKIPNIGLFSGFTTTNTAPTGAACAQEVTVQLSGTYRFSFLRLIGFKKPIPIDQSTTMRYERQPFNC